MRKFPRTFHALDSERPGVSIGGLALVSILLLAWLIWLFGARISVFEVTPMGRFEVDRAAYPITSQVDGRVMEVPMTMGRRIHTGELLVQLETRQLELELEQEQARGAAIGRELEATRQELEFRRGSLNQNRRASRLAVEETRTRQRGAEIESEFADQQEQRYRRLFEDGLISQQEADRLSSEASKLRETTKTHDVTARKQETEVRGRELDDQTEIALLNRDLARLEGEAGTLAVNIKLIRHNIEQRSILAPHDGEISEVIDLPIMTMVRGGDRLGTILAAGEIRVIGEFAAFSALGRVAPGQSARIRLDGFPWTQYGMLSARVKQVAREPRAGRLRVELEIEKTQDTKSSRIPLQHGLTGTVEVEVEHISPFGLLMRTLGKVLNPVPSARDVEPRVSGNG